MQFWAKSRKIYTLSVLQPEPSGPGRLTAATPALQGRNAQRGLGLRLRTEDRNPSTTVRCGRFAPCAVYRTIINGFRQEQDARLYTDIRSVIETAQRRSIHVADAIRCTLKGELLHPEGPAST